MKTKDGFMRTLTTTILAALWGGVAHAAPPVWATTAGKVNNNGSVTVKSVSSTATYGATQNPTGNNAKVNKTSTTQPPLVIQQNITTSNQWSMYYADRARPLP